MADPVSNGQSWVVHILQGLYWVNVTSAGGPRLPGEFRYQRCFFGLVGLMGYLVARTHLVGGLEHGFYFPQ